MDSRAFLHHLISQSFYAGQMAHIENIKIREACHGELETLLPNALDKRLRSLGLLPLYAHQAKAVNATRAGRNVMVATASASGKTLCYNIPVLEELTGNKNSRALYIFPTKALAQDQFRGLRELVEKSLLGGDEVDVFDGDTPSAERAQIRQQARILLTNPDMLHLGILPNHRNWSRFFRNLKFVVVDEAHSYRGVFGSHVALVLRRLRRLCRTYGSEPRFIFCSATVANPAQHAENLAGLPFDVVEEDGSPQGGKDFVFWNPPVIDDVKGTRHSANSESSSLFAELVRNNIRTLNFTRSRRLTELIYNYSKQRLKEISPKHAALIKPYRAGYLPQDRRKIEKELFNGSLMGAVTTNALELGIDIGGLDATILTGYPGSIASTWQQAGRSGRSGGGALSFLIGLDNPLDQYFMRHPDFFFKKNYENVLINPENTYILKAHLLAAAWEMPLISTDRRFFGETMAAEIEELEKRRLLKGHTRRWHLSASVNYPAQEINIRSTSGHNFALLDASTGVLLETVEESHAFFQLHKGAIYLHQGDSYLVQKLDIEARTAYAEPTKAVHYTIAKDLTDVGVKKVLKRKQRGQADVFLGEVEVTVDIVGFKKKKQFTEEVIGEEPLEMPPQYFNTVGFWFNLSPELIKGLEKAELDVAGGLHAVEHAAIAILPLFALCDRNDIGGVSTLFHPDTKAASIFIYDAYPGGIGIAEKGFELIGKLWRATRDAITECPCRDGCPSCIQSPKCGNNNKPLDKKAAVRILNGLLGGKPA